MSHIAFIIIAEDLLTDQIAVRDISISLTTYEFKLLFSVCSYSDKCIDRSLFNKTKAQVYITGTRYFKYIISQMFNTHIQFFFFNL